MGRSVLNPLTALGSGCGADVAQELSPHNAGRTGADDISLSQGLR